MKSSATLTAALALVTRGARRYAAFQVFCQASGRANAGRFTGTAGDLALGDAFETYARERARRKTW
jgi:hypothetical protein